MHSTTTYIVYWDPRNVPTPYPEGYLSGINRFFKDLEHDNGGDQNFYSVLTQYGVSYDTHFGKALMDRNPCPAQTTSRCGTTGLPCMTTTQVGNERTSWGGQGATTVSIPTA